MAKAKIEQRFEDCGFVYTERTRMLYAPIHASTRKDTDEGKTDLVMSCARHWPEPIDADIKAVRTALIKAFPDRRLHIDTTEGLVPIYEPSAA